MKHSPDLHAKNGKSSASSEPEPVQWWLKTAPAKRRVGRPRKVHPPLNADPVELPDGIVDLPHMNGIDWSKPAGTFEMVCSICDMARVWVAGATLRRHGLLRCAKGHVMAVVVAEGEKLPKVRAA